MAEARRRVLWGIEATREGDYWGWSINGVRWRWKRDPAGATAHVERLGETSEPRQMVESLAEAVCWSYGFSEGYTFAKAGHALPSPVPPAGPSLPPPVPPGPVIRGTVPAVPIARPIGKDGES